MAGSDLFLALSATHSEALYENGDSRWWQCAKGSDTVTIHCQIYTDLWGIPVLSYQVVL